MTSIRSSRPQANRWASLLGLGSFVAAAIFWYGGGYLAVADNDLINFRDVDYYVSIFFVTAMIVYLVSRSYHSTSTRLLNVATEKLNDRRIVFGVIALLVAYGMLRSIGGTLYSVHGIRIVQVAGIIAGVMLLKDTGRYRLLYGALFAVAAVLCLSAYSRRPFLTLAAVPIILYFARSNARQKTVVSAAIAVVIAALALVFVTGLRSYSWDGGLGEVPVVMARGMDFLSQTNGFDTIWLLDYVVATYPERHPFLNGSSLLGALLNPIPRAWWPDKPNAFGVDLASLYFNVLPDRIPTNFGPGIVTEAYANGGGLMVILWAAGLGYILARFDLFAWSRQATALGRIAIVMVPPVIFFLIRGDLLNSWYEFYVKAAPALLVLNYAGAEFRVGRGQLR
ncbi:MAG: hypothetical protein E5Y65_15590 [Mesorhizobium sp.]|uniref:hypothetical protein n=1 Tax=Mesorhizobium sp. TaxID=1871066 RepID=UPI0011FA64B1|nr:hypothetical protein [Mesorhizobium sp.]TIL90084.1 MAG: hypothetical protein E5Y65_15590 [Mesorhizobium sp.]TIM01820.1 MAG: hypothetical protein E5Y64_09605 [Mesorhizobium sp.]